MLVPKELKVCMYWSVCRINWKQKMTEHCVCVWVSAPVRQRESVTTLGTYFVARFNFMCEKERERERERKNNRHKIERTGVRKDGECACVSMSLGERLEKRCTKKPLPTSTPPPLVGSTSNVSSSFLSSFSRKTYPVKIFSLASPNF